MSLKLAQYFHTDRFKTATLVMDINEVRASVEELICLMYPQRGCRGTITEEDLNKSVVALKGRLEKYISSVERLNPSIKGKASDIAENFLNKLPEIARITDTDVEAAFNGDPAAYSKEEIIITYPGFYAICVYRLAHALHKLDVPLIPRLMSEYAHEKTGIDIHPGAVIGENFFVDHGTGVVIGETSLIGKNVKIYQGVTLGALSVKKKLQSVKRHPTIESDVVIYANSTILGGDTIIGTGSVIGGNTWITESVPAQSVIMNKSELSIGKK
jgi:serine O-acetyltransferase